MYTVKVHYDGWLALPAALRDALKLETNSQLDVEVIGQEIHLRRTDPVLVTEPRRRGRPPKAKPGISALLENLFPDRAQGTAPEQGPQVEAAAPRRRGRPPKLKLETTTRLDGEPAAPRPGRPPKAKPGLSLTSGIPRARGRQAVLAG